MKTCAFCGKAFEEKKGHPARFCSGRCRQDWQNADRIRKRAEAAERKEAEKRLRKEAKENAEKPVFRDQCDGCKDKGRPLLCFHCRDGFKIRN